MIDPVFRNSRREGVVIAAFWLLATAYCCGFYYLFGYSRPDRPLTAEDYRPILGMPWWFFWGVLFPWFLCGLFIFFFAGFVMTDDDLGADHASELESDIREAARDE